MAWTDRLRHPAVRESTPPAQRAPTVESGLALRDIANLAYIEEDRRGYVEGTSRGGYGMSSSTSNRPMGQSHVERHLLYQIYLQETWCSACIELIARRVTSGGIDFEPTTESPNEANRDALEEWFEWCNPYENFRDICMSAIRGMLIWGDGYWEKAQLNDNPFELYTLDSLTVDKIANRQGVISEYLQWDDDPGSGVRFKPNEVINFKLASPRGGLYGISPTRRLLLPSTIDLFAQAWNRTSMKNGSTGVKVVEMPEGTDESVGRRMLRYVRENFSGARNAGKDMVMWGGAKVTQVGQSHVEMSYLEGRKFTREEILAAYGVSGHMLGLPEVGSLGGGPAIEAAERAFYMNTIEPLQGILLEQLNFHIVDGAPGSFGIKDWKVQFKNPDYRDSASRAKEAEMKTRTGVWTPNEARAKSNDGDDRKPIAGGDRAVIEFRGNLIPVDELDKVSYLTPMGDEPDTVSKVVTPKSGAKSDTKGTSKAGSGTTGDQGQSGSTAAPTPNAASKQTHDVLNLWERKAVRRLKDGRPALVGFSSEHIPAGLQREVEKQLGMIERDDADDAVRSAFRSALDAWERTAETVSDD